MTVPVLPSNMTIAGAHWLQFEDADLVGVFDWVPTIRMWLAFELIHNMEAVSPEDVAGYGWTYIEPVLTPADVAELRSRITVLQDENAELCEIGNTNLDVALRAYAERDAAVATIKELRAEREDFRRHLAQVTVERDEAVAALELEWKP